MSKNVALFVDVANLYYSARGQDVDVDYVALLKTATKGRDLIRAYAYSGLDPENENQRKFIDFLNKNGYKVLTKDIRKFGDGRVKANLDIELVVDLFRLADRMDIAVIVSGDGDFAPAIKALQDKGIRCEVISFRPNTSSDLIAVADEFIDIMKIAGIGRGSKEAKAQRGMSAPEMPAKEVVPEFGFREASPGVAAAALAALREGRPESGPRTRGRGRASSSALAPAAEAVAEEPEAVVLAGDEPGGADGEARRRRRRRGGRGRGRRGRGQGESAETGETGSAEVAGEPGEIGWVELDDLSQLTELEGVEDLGAEHEFSFEEADAATLAELGIAPDAVVVDEAAVEAKPARRRASRRAVEADTAVAGAAEPEPEAKKPTRRRAAKKAGAEVAEAPEATGAAEAPEAPEGPPEPEATAAKPKRTRSRAASTTSRSRTTAKGGEAGIEEKKPARRRTTRKAAGSDAEPENAASGDAAGEETEGIWQRFRSARGRTGS